VNQTHEILPFRLAALFPGLRGAVMGYCGQTMFNALVNIDHLINKKPEGADAGRAIINKNMRQAVRHRAFRIALNR